jgi:hypothetical protein
LITPWPALLLSPHPQQRRPSSSVAEFPMRLLFATIAAALAALSGEVIEFEGLYPTR